MRECERFPALHRLMKLSLTESQEESGRASDQRKQQAELSWAPGERGAHPDQDQVLALTSSSSLPLLPGSVLALVNHRGLLWSKIDHSRCTGTNY